MADIAASSVALDLNGVHRQDQHSCQIVHNIFGRRDTTPWAVLWLALIWAAVELVPGLSLLHSELTAARPTGDAIGGGFFTAALFAAGAYWTWWAMMGSMGPSRRWQVLVVSCGAVVAARLFLAEPLQTLLAVFAWSMMGTAAVALATRYLLGYSLTAKGADQSPHFSTEQHVQPKNELSIWMLLRYTLAAAILAWFTRSVAEAEEGVLSSLEIVCLGIPLGLVNGGLSFLILWMLNRKWWWVYIGIFVVVALPIGGGVTFYASNQGATQSILPVTLFAAAISSLGHLIFFGLPLIAQGFYFGAINKVRINL